MNGPVALVASFVITATLYAVGQGNALLAFCGAVGWLTFLALVIFEGVRTGRRAP